MRILFIGSVEFSKEALLKLIDLKAYIAGVITKKASSFNADFVDLSNICIKNKIPWKYVKNINSQKNIDWMREKTPDIIFCFGWSSLLKQDILNLATNGVVGFHPAKLPYNRGRHPLIWALTLGLQKNSYNKIPQDHAKANYWRKRSRIDGRIDFRMSSRTIYNLVRALTSPYIGAHIEYNDADIKIWKCREVESPLSNIEPGKILDIIDNEILVKCYEGAVLLVEHDFKDLPSKGEYL